MPVRVRFAPSPTGSLHVGGARTALFNYLFAKKHKGSFILRIEDTDQDRHQEESLKPLLENLKWLGLNWDEGPFFSSSGIDSKGPLGPYRQRDRLSIYKAKALELIDKGRAYYCFMTEEEEAQRKASVLKGKSPWRAFSPDRDLPLKSAKERIQKGEKFCIRFKTIAPDTHYIIEDLLRGEIRYPSDSLGDFILIRTDAFPVYNFSCAVDDGLMQISHVFRGEEHLSNSLKQKLIQQALNLPQPKIGHLSIILGKDKKKLSKRSGAENLQHYKKEGYLPSAINNFLALLGWNPGTDQEFFSMDELIKNFSVAGLNLSAALFDPNKLLWLNEKHLKALPELELAGLIKDFVKKPLPKDRSLKSFISPLLSNFKTLKSSAKIIELFSDDGFSIQESALQVLHWPTSPKLIKSWLKFLQALSKPNMSWEDFKVFQKSTGLKGKEFFMPLRSALIGQPEGLELKILISLLTKDQMLKRAEQILQNLKNQ